MKQKIVIKLGGSSLQDPQTLKELAVLVQGYRKRQYDVVIVHGGGPAINQELKARGIKWTFIEGQRQTKPEMIDIIEDVLANKVNQQIVEALRSAGILAAGFSGSRDQILECVQSHLELMQVGRVIGVDTSALEASFMALPNVTPVIAPIGFGPSGEKYNVNADVAAAQIAIALGAKHLIFLTDQVGILDQDRQLVSHVDPLMVERMIESGVISGGMCAKVRAMTAALRAGVKQVRVLYSGCAGQVLDDKNIGTILTERQPLTHKDVMHGRAS